MQNEKTSPQQYERMVNLLSDYPDIAQNYTQRTPETVAVFWEDLSNQLNALGPRQRDVGGWKKVWSDYKCYIKKKVTANKKEIAGTGGGPCRQKSFTPLEDAVIALTNIASSVSGIGATSFGVGNTSHQVPLNEPSTSNTANGNEKENQSATSNGKTRRQRPASSIQLLTKQVKNQESFQKEVKHFFRDTNRTLRKLQYSIDELGKIEKEKLEETQNHNREMRQIAVQKLELKKRKLEFKIAENKILRQ